MSLMLRLLSRLPLPLLYALASVASVLLYHVARYRRRVVTDNLACAFPGLDQRQRDAIARGFYRHLCDLAMEVMASLRMPVEELQQRIRLENPELFHHYLERGKPFLLLVAHQGNWEWMLHTFSAMAPCPLHPVYKPLHNAAMDRFMLACRSRFSHPVAFKDTGRAMLRNKGDFRIYAMVADQAPFKKDKQRHWHDFFGQPAAFYLGPQKLAEAFQFPVIYIAMTKLRRGYYSARLELLAEPPHAKGGSAILDRYIDAVERSIRAQPHTWLWSNRKWKHRPPERVATPEMDEEGT